MPLIPGPFWVARAYHSKPDNRVVAELDRPPEPLKLSPRGRAAAGTWPSSDDRHLPLPDVFFAVIPHGTCMDAAPLLRAPLYQWAHSAVAPRPAGRVARTHHRVFVAKDGRPGTSITLPSARVRPGYELLGNPPTWPLSLPWMPRHLR